ncbi:MAG TPA: protocatechuate 3,4-dioxygenase subunit alpha [Kribbella sp.]|nr:protocatechuate 3,4-dioxygenase subunit alpha [Kribbella sp.]
MMTDLLGSTPSQTVGPFLAIGLDWADGPELVPDGTPGAVVLTGSVVDGAGEVVPDGMVEIWQADPSGRFGASTDFRGLGRSMTDASGTYWFRTLLPGATDDEAAPYIAVSIFARGLLKHLVTRIYLPDEVAVNAADPVLRTLDDSDRRALTARWDGDGRLVFDIRLQGPGETPFFEV